MSRLEELLRNASIFGDLPDSLINELASSASEVRVPAGGELFRQGDAGEFAYFISEGEVEIIRNEAGAEIMQAVRGPGEVIGEMALVEDQVRTATVRARSDTCLIAIGRQHFDKLLMTSPNTARTIFKTMLTRWRQTEQNLRLAHRLAALGTHAAGIAHEINNPAAAIRRSAEHLNGAFVNVLTATASLPSPASGEDRTRLLDTLAHRAREHAIEPPQLSPIDRSDREADIQDWLEQHDIGEGWTMGPALVNLGYTTDELDELASQSGPALLPRLLDWVVAVYDVFNLVSEIRLAGDRISEVVASVKGYTQLDRAPVQEFDVTRGIDDTLVILRHKLKQNIQVSRSYAPNLPRIEGYPSELNQVWTNIVDNAADALEEQGGGTLDIRVWAEGDAVVIEFEDNGPGIPAEIRDRIFDPFFTTKPQGKGNGLGLNLAYNTIVYKHRGEIQVDSEPGRTCFHIRLPLRPGAATAHPPDPATQHS